MNTRRIFILFSSLILLFVFTKSAYTEKYHFRNYSVDDGLPHPKIIRIFQDRDGYMWFGIAGGGVSRFDGKNFTNYSTRDGLFHNWAFPVFQDKKGNIWFHTAEYITKYDGENWTILKGEEEIPYRSNLWCGLEDSGGRLWFGTDNGVAMFEGDSLWLIDTKELGGGNWVSSIIEDKNVNIWVGTDEGVLKYDGTKWITYDIPGLSIFEDSRGAIWFGGLGTVSKFNGTDWKAYSLPVGFEEYWIGSICEDREANLWFGQYIYDVLGNIKKGVVKFDGASWMNFTTENGLASNIAYELYNDREGNIWIGTLDKGICRFSDDRFTTYTTDDGLATNRIGRTGIHYNKGMVEDSQGHVWCMTEEGISRFDGNNWLTYNTENVLRDNRIYSCLKDSKGCLWFCTSGGWIVKFDGEQFTHYSREETGLRFADVILEDDNGNLWFGGSPGKVSRFDGENWITYGEQRNIPGGRALSMLKDSKGNLWVGNNWWGELPGEGGVTRHDGKNWITYSKESLGISNGDKGIFFYSQDSIIKYKYEEDKWIRGGTEPRGAVDEEIENYLAGDKLAGNWVFEITEDREGNIWFGTILGLSKYDGSLWTTYTTKNGLIENNVRFIFEDSDGLLWFGTNNGLSRFDGSKFTNYTTEDGLLSNVCYYIFEHGDYIYIGTSGGLNRFDGERFKTFTEREGLAASELTFSYLKDSKGNLWFGTRKGLTKFNPSPERPNQVLPPVYIAKASLFGKDITGKKNSRFSYKENNLRFDYIGICLTSPEDVLYKYKLEGLDSDWIETAEVFASYPYLPPGEYAFKVKACNNEGLWNEKPATISFEILPPFWITLWFRSLLLAVVALSVYGTYAARTRHLRNRNQRQKREIAERKEQAAKLQNALEEVERLKSRLEDEKVYLQKEIKINHNFEEIISLSEVLKNVLLKVEQVAATETTVLILGETGTGKELIARAIHHISARSDHPMVKVNCAALPATLIESELFGHEKGAFTGAHSRQIGHFELADKGTIFLDEIGELPLELQSKLLRVLESGEFQRLGDPHYITVDVRVLAASNRDLEKEVGTGNFREDLYYRLNVYPIVIPPLRDHREDIPLLVRHFVKKHGTRIGKRIESLPQSVLNTLQAYDWPGNVRELENIIERAVVVSRRNQLELGELTKIGSLPRQSLSTLKEYEREYIISVLESTGWRVSGERGAAEILDLKPTTLYSRMKKLDIKHKR